MADVKWTDNQIDAIDARGGAVLVSAAAGSGKTAVLVERAIQMITDPVSPVDADRLLVVTYTRAAAREMKERIDKRLEEMIENNPFDENLNRQQMLLAKAQICTIHSFCSELAREFFYILDIPSDFRIAEDQELAIMKSAAINDVIEQAYEDGNTDFLEMSDMFSTSKNDNSLRKIILGLYEFLRSYPFPKRWADEKIAMYRKADSVFETEWGKVILERTKVMAEFAQDLSKQSLELLLEEPVLNNAKFGDMIREEDGMIADIIEKINSGSWDDIAKGVGLFRNRPTINTPKGYANNETKIKITNNRDAVKKLFNEKIAKMYSFSEEECLNEIDELAPIVRSMFDIMHKFEDRYSSMKTERKIADFSDLEHWALRLLVKDTDRGIETTETGKLISSRFDYVMVDEYQDANDIQDTIFKAVSDNDKKLFVVGDVKQSIYRFRQAMPEIFIGRKNRYRFYDRNSEQYPAKIILDKNFRSRKGITEAVNFVFRNLMSENVGDIDYSDEEKLVFGAESYGDDTEPCVSYHLIDINDPDCADDDDDETDNDKGNAADVGEARYIAILINKMIGESGQDGKKKLTYGDFCILMRSVKGHADIFVEELRKNGIQAVCETEESFFSRREIKIVLSLLRIIDNPVQDIPLASVMLSPVFGFSEDELTRIRIDNPHGSLYAALLSESKNGNDKADSFIGSLRRLRKISASLPTDVLLDRIYTETSLPEIVSAEEEGEFKRKNLRLLLEYAKSYENAGFRGVGGFVRFINGMEENGTDLTCAENRESADNAVRIMTIHKSKGLEFPVCIIAGMNRKINTDTTNEILLHNKLGLGIKHRDKERMCKYTTMPREAVSMEIKRNELSEELRVLYVALTRAKEKLILVSGINSKAKDKNHIDGYFSGIIGKLSYDGNAIGKYSVSSVNKMGELIAMCALIHPAHHDLRQDVGYTGRFALGNEKPWEIIRIDDLRGYFKNYAEEAKTQREISDSIIAGGVLQEEFELEKKRYSDLIKERMSLVYKYEKLSELPMKVSASVLAHKDNERAFAAMSKPEFMTKDKLSATQRGTAVHAFVQYCDIVKARDSVRNEIDRLVEQGFITKVQGDSIDIGKAESFVNSSLADRMLRSPSLSREYRFTVEIPASSIDNTLEYPYGNEKIVLQGAIDCMFEEDGKMVVVDYKTDRAKDPLKLAEMYKEQLRLYKLAVEQITGKSVGQCLLYSFAMSCEVMV